MRTFSAILFLVYAGGFTYGQIDHQLRSISIYDRPHFSDTNFQSIMADKDELKLKGEPKIVLFKPLFIQKYQGAWMYDADSCSIKRIKASKMAYFSSGTKAIYCGLSFDAGVKNRKSLRAVSFPILEEMRVGDSLHVQLTILADRDYVFQPEVYTSEKIKVRQKKLRTGKYLNYHGPVSQRSENDNDLINTGIIIPITEELMNIQWVHIVNNEDEQHRGFIIESIHRLGGIADDEYIRVFYANDSYALNNESKQILDEIIKNLQPTNAVILRGYADPSGQKEYNMNLAHKRAKAVLDYFVEHGVDPDRVKIEEYDILHNKKAKDNRICTILVL